MSTRRTIRSTLAALALALLAALPGAAMTGATVVPGGLGYDISWPQCNQALPGDPSELDIVGVTGGQPFTANPCLGAEASWAQSGHLPMEVYVNLNSPSSASDPHAANGPWGACAASDTACQGYNYGYNAAVSAVATGGGAGVSAQVWWLDVETGDRWSSDTTENSWDVRGAVDGLRAKGKTAGIYSITHMWLQITNGVQMGDVPVWVPGPAALDYAGFYCSQGFSFEGGPVWMVQYPRGGLDGDLLCTAQQGWTALPAWHGGTALTSTGGEGVPVVVSPSPGVLEVFWKGSDSALWHSWLSAGTWHGPESLGGVLASDPSAVSPSPGVVDVFYKGVDQDLWHRWDSNGWQGPQRLGGGPLATPPQAVASGGGNVAVFWRSRANALTYMSYAGGWSAAQVLVTGALGDGQPQPVSSATGQMDVLWRGADGNLWDEWFLDGWHGPDLHAYGPLGSDPHAVGWGSGHLEVFWAGTDSLMREAVYAPGYGWDDSPRLVSSQTMYSVPGPASWGPGDTDVYYRGPDQDIWHSWFGREVSLNDGPTRFAPSAATTSLGTVAVAWKGVDGNVWVDWYG